MATVKFHELSEFRDELELNVRKIEGNVLRLTCGHRREEPMTVLWLIATVLVGNLVVRLESRCGSYLLSDSREGEAVQERVKAHREFLENVATELGLEIRAGMYEG